MWLLLSFEKSKIVDREVKDIELPARVLVFQLANVTNMKWDRKNFFLLGDSFDRLAFFFRFFKVEPTNNFQKKKVFEQ